MDEQYDAIVHRSLHVKFTFLLVILLLSILVGNWLSFQQAKRILFRELETRGSWMVRNLSYNAGYAMAVNDKNVLHELLDGVLREQDVVYVVLVNPQRDMLFLTSKLAKQPLIFPEITRQVLCDRETPLVHSHLLNSQQVYDVGLRIVSKTTCLGTVHLGVSLSNLDRELTQLLLTFLGFCLFVIVIGVISYGVTSRILVAPIVRMAEVAMRISTGDLRQTIEITSEDEVGLLEAALLRILVASRAIAGRLKHACEQIKTASDEMLSMSEEQSGVSQRQSASIHQISTTIADIARSSTLIAKQAENVAKVAETTLQATHDIDQTVKNTMTGMQDIKEQVEKNAERGVQLGEKVSQIGNVVKMINTIADQTRLIAFNASIESSGFGEADGRFTVVATEVRRLANTVVEALADIRQAVSSIQSATSEVILSSETEIRKVYQGVEFIAETGKTLQRIIELIDRTTQAAKDISIATRQQQDEHGQIVTEIKDIASGSEQSVTMSTRTTKIAKELRALANELDEAVQNFVTE
jgi:methyl-accepting chemotaxis protein